MGMEAMLLTLRVRDHCCYFPIILSIKPRIFHAFVNISTNKLCSELQIKIFLINGGPGLSYLWLLDPNLQVTCKCRNQENQKRQWKGARKRNIWVQVIASKWQRWGGRLLLGREVNAEGIGGRMDKLQQMMLH